ncbi:sensor domain-containing diguanylate cyclase [Alkalithermobacter paradoxus]|uniref:Putative diguanylate cyclase YegE n=1 Tax=Alkalithermobacter paradoxus TaxID=29349 RepID=A0A1V4I577_9FIRM|nr:putative diguanylate cyclase YegE [[Clostridium] thermoalcaliphilum]
MHLREKAQQNLSRELFIEIKVDGTIQDVTSNCVNIVEYTKEEMIGYNIKEIFQNNEFGAILDKNQDFEIREITIKDKNNKNIYMSVKRDFIKEDNREFIYLSMLDITKHKEELNRAKRIVRIFERSNDIICSYNLEGEYRMDYISPSIYKNLGMTIEENKDNPMMPLEVVHPDDYDLHLKKFKGEVDYDQYFETRFKHKDGRYIWFEEYITPVYDEEGKLVAIESIVRNIQKRKELEEKLTYLSYHDTLTGVYNRTYFEKYKNELNKEKNRSVGVIICDLDNLKPINDNLGHEAGDKLLKETARLIQENVGADILVARIGGDEFVILMEDIECKEVKARVNAIIKSIDNYNSCDPEIPIRLSMGYDYNENSIGCMEMIFRNADRNMYRDKHSKKVG